MVMPNAKPTVALETAYVGKSKVKWARLPNEAEYDAQQVEDYDTTICQ
jgi:hypothetical protein